MTKSDALCDVLDELVSDAKVEMLSWVCSRRWRGSLACTYLLRVAINEVKVSMSKRAVAAGLSTRCVSVGGRLWQLLLGR